MINPKVSPTIPHILRSMVEQDKAFIFTSWIHGAWKTPPMTYCSPDFFLPHQREIVTKLLETANVVVAVDPQDPDYILGFVCYEFVAGVLHVHWMHIKDTYRKMGLGHAIIESIYPEVTKKTIICTQNSFVMKPLRNKYLLSYNPFFITDRLQGKL